MVLKVIMLVVFFAIMLGVGFYSRKHTKDVNGFVLGGRSVGPWLTPMEHLTSQRLYSLDMPDSLDGSTELLPHG